MSVTQGNLLVAAIIELVLAGTFFVSKVFRAWNLEGDTRVLLRADLHGLKGRGLVANRDETGNLVDDPPSRSSDTQRSAALDSTVAHLSANPRLQGLSLVAELIRPLRPDLAHTAALEEQLERRLRFDRRNGKFRVLGFLEPQPGTEPT